MDNRPSTNKLHHFVPPKKILHVTHDMWHVTHDTLTLQVYPSLSSWCIQNCVLTTLVVCEQTPTCPICSTRPLCHLVCQKPWRNCLFLANLWLLLCVSLMSALVVSRLASSLGPTSTRPHHWALLPQGPGPLHHRVSLVYRSSQLYSVAEQSCRM